MKFSEALDQYMDGRDRLREFSNEGISDYVREVRRDAVAKMREAQEVMDRLAPR